jgi:hypothetical protein
MAPALATYESRDPSRTILYKVIAEHLEAFLVSLDADPAAKGLPDYVQREFYDYLQCGILAHGFLRLGCDTCNKEVLLPFSCKRRGFCPSCAGRRMAQTAAHLVECVMPWVPTRQWVVSVPMPLRYWTAPSRDLTAQVHGIIRTTIAQFYVNQAVRRGAERQKVQPGSVTFLQRFGGTLQLNLHYHVIVIEGVFLDRTDQGLKPRFLKSEPPSDADVAHVVQKISRQIIRTLRRLGYLEAGMEVPVATGYDPLLDSAPELARTMAASVEQRIAFGERAGQKVRRIGSDFGSEGERPELKGPRCASVHGFSLHANTAVPAHRWDQLERLMRYTARGALSLERLEQNANGDLIYRFNRPWSDGTTGIKLSPLELLEKLAALVPLPRAHLVRYGGCLAPHSKLRAAIIPTPHQQGIDGDASKTATPYWHWARLLGRVFDLAMATCPFCRRGPLRDCVGAGQLCCPSLRIIAAILPPLRGRREARRRAAPTQSRQALRPSPGVGDYPYPASPSAGLRATSHCPCPPAPRDMRVRRRPRQRGAIGVVRTATA